MAQDGSPYFLPGTAAANAPGAAPSFEAATAAAGAPGGAPSFAAATATAQGSAGATASTGYSNQFLPATASGDATGAGVAQGDASFEAMTGGGNSPAIGDASFEEATASGTVLTGGAATGDATFQPLQISASSVAVGIATGDATFQTAVVSGAAHTNGDATGDISFGRMQVSGAALAGGIASAAIDMLPLDGTASAYAPSFATGSGTFEAALAAGISVSTLASTTRTWVANMSTEALSEYRNFDFNSFAEFDGRYFAAGPDGIVELTGADDEGENIAWVMRTGFLDGKDAMLKRLEEVLLTIRFDGHIRVRVWTDDGSVFSYTLENHRKDVIHQVRAKLGRGAKSRYYRIELAGLDGSSAQISSMQLPFIPTTRRIG